MGQRLNVEGISRACFCHLLPLSTAQQSPMLSPSLPSLLILVLPSPIVPLRALTYSTDYGSHTRTQARDGREVAKGMATGDRLVMVLTATRHGLRP